MIHIEHVLSLVPVVAGRVNCDPAFPIYALQVIRLLPLHCDRLEQATHSLHGPLVKLALIVPTLIHIELGGLVVCKWHLLRLRQVLMARELSLLIHLVVGIVLRCSPILVKLVNVLI